MPPSRSSTSFRVAIVGPRANRMPSSIFATSTPDGISTDMPRASSLELKPPIEDPTIQARHKTYSWIAERRDHFTQAIGPDARVAVRDKKKRMRGRFDHRLERADLCVWINGGTGQHDPRRNLRILSPQRLDDNQ